jgi:hypothetical protein
MSGRLGVIVLFACGLLPSVAAGEPPGAEPFLFPPGTYILGGGPKPATGRDAAALRVPFALHPDLYVLSGGPRPTDPILVDDDLEVHLGKTPLFIDDDHVRSSERRGGLNCTYAGEPILLALPPGSTLRVRAIDHAPTEAILGELYLHRSDGAKWRLTEGRRARSSDRRPHTFFEETFALAAGFKRPLVPAARRPSAARLDALWADLAAAGAGKAYLALWELAAAPEQAAPFLKEHLPPAPAPGGRQREQTARWIADLDSDSFAVREKAMAELRKCIDTAEPALRQARERKSSPEARRRIDELLEERGKAAIPLAEDLRVLRAVEALGHMRTAEAHKLLEALAKGAPAARRTVAARQALRRLADGAAAVSPPAP